MNRALWRIIIPIALVFICSCNAAWVVGARQPQANITQERNHSTEIEEGEGVVVVLNTFYAHDKSIESEGEEKSLENCVSKGMMKTNQRLRIVSAKDFRRTVFPNKKFEDSPRSSEVLVSFLSDPDTRNRLTEVGLRYVIFVSATTSESETRSHHESDFKESITYMYVREWTKYYSMTADVLDVKYLRESGSVRASSSGDAGWGFITGAIGSAGCCLPIPPILFYYVERPETEACSALGEAVMKFIIEGHDVVPAPELVPGIDSGGGSPGTQTEPRSGSEEDLLKRTQEPERYDKDSQN